MAEVEVNPVDPLDPNADPDELVAWVRETMELVGRLQIKPTPQMAVREALELEGVERDRFVAMCAWAQWTRAHPEHDPRLTNPN